MASSKSIRELRIITDTSADVVFRNAATDSWALTNNAIHKIRCVDYDDSALIQEGISDPELRQRMYDSGAAIPGLNKGALKFSTHLGSAPSGATATSVHVEANIMEAVLGGIRQPGIRSVAIGAASTAVNITIASATNYCNIGMAALIGVRGDARGNGEVKPINAVASGSIGLAVACQAAPSSGDPIIFSTTCFPQENAIQKYIHTLALGHAAADQRQTISGSGTLKISQLGIGQLPKVDYEITPLDHNFVNVGDRATMGLTYASEGSNPSFDRGIGHFHFGDSATSTRTIIKGGDFTFDPGIKHDPVPSPDGVNGYAAYQKIPGIPTLEFSVLYDEDMPGLRDDFQTKTAKRVVLQMGHSNGRCAAIEMMNCYLDSAPVPNAIGNFSGLKIKVHAAEPSSTNDNLRDAAFKIHWF